MQLTGKVTLGDTSTEAASIASYNGKLYIAWKGVGNNQLNVMYSTDDGQTFGHKFTSSETSIFTPELCVHEDKLFISWVGVGNDQLNVAQVVGN